MVTSSLRIRNFYWADTCFQPPLDGDSADDFAEALSNLRGQFSFAVGRSDGSLMLARDPLGSNKLFFAIHESTTVVVANYLIDLVTGGVPFESVYSVPAGHLVEIDVSRRTLRHGRYFNVEAEASRPDISLGRTAQNIREHLELWFFRLAEQFRDRKICLCLSGGLDSSLIAAMAAKHFPDVTAYTYGYAGSDGRESDDLSYARRVADFLGLRLRPVRATSDEVLDAVQDAVCYGQDWREFNVHCAIVNEILARAIEHDAHESTYQERPLVLTGDLANELLADYTPLSYEGRVLYSLPRIGSGPLRTVLLRGLDSGDREVGIFNQHGIDVIQPYGLLVDQYLQLPACFIGGESSKQVLVRTLAGDLLPSFIFGRQKVRAQIGDSVGPGGILSTLTQAGCDSRWLRRAFCDRFRLKEENTLNAFIRLGRYRFLSELPQGRYDTYDSDARDDRRGYSTLHSQRVSNTCR